MINLHKISFDWKQSQIAILNQYGIKVESGYDSFWLEENKIYFKLKPYFENWKVSETVISKFSSEEENNAKRLILLSPWANGYPMPDLDFGFRRTTYDDSDFCSNCGVGLIQKEPFKLKANPNWGSKKKMFSLNWIFDELFVKNIFYEDLFNKYGIAKEKVLLFNEESVINDTVQLIIPITEISLNLEEYYYEICKICSRKRYDLITKGFFPGFNGDVNNLHLLKSKEWFGTGSNARKYIFISAELRQKILDSKMRPNFIPCL